MDIYFQSGEFILDSDGTSLLGISIDTLVTVLLTILIFGLGYWLNGLVEENKELHRLSDLNVYVSQIIKINSAPIEEQAEALNRFGEQLRRRSRNFGALDIFTSIFLTPLKQINHLDLYKIYVHQPKQSIEEKAADFQSLNAGIDHIITEMNDLNNRLQALSSFTENDLRLWDTNLFAITNLSNQFFSDFKIKYGIPSTMVSNPENYPEERFYFAFDSLMKQWAAQVPFQESQLYYTYETVIQQIPLMMKNHVDARMTSLVTYVNECNRAFNGFVEVKNSYANIFISMANEFRQMNLNMNRVVDKYPPQPKRTLFQLVLSKLKSFTS